MKNPLRLGLLTLCIVTVPGMLSLYQRRWWSAAAYLATLAYLLISAFSIQYSVFNLTLYPKTFFAVTLLLASAHFVALSARLVMSAEYSMRVNRGETAFAQSLPSIHPHPPVQRSPSSFSMMANQIQQEQVSK